MAAIRSQSRPWEIVSRKPLRATFSNHLLLTDYQSNSLNNRSKGLIDLEVKMYRLSLPSYQHGVSWYPANKLDSG